MAGKWEGRANQDVEERGDDDGAVAGEEGVGDEGSEEGEKKSGAAPEGDSEGGGGGGLAERARHVAYEVEHDAIVGHSLRYFQP